MCPFRPSPRRRIDTSSAEHSSIFPHPGLRRGRLLTPPWPRTMLPVSKTPLRRGQRREATSPSGKTSRTQGVTCTRPHPQAPVATRMIDSRARLALEPLGFDDRLEKLFRPLLAKGLLIGRV